MTQINLRFTQNPSRFQLALMGVAGQGVPVGGTTGQVLKKATDASYDTEWEDESGGGGGAVSSVFGRSGAVTAQSGDYALAQITGLQGSLDLKAPLADPTLTGTPAAPTATGGTNTTQIATTAFVQGAVNAIIAAADAMVFKGVVDCSANPDYPAADRGWTYKVSVAGKIGGASGVDVEAGDTLLCLTDGTVSGDQATVGAQWNITQANLDGAVIGPASSVDGYFALFSGTGGNLLQSVSPAAVKAALGIVASDISDFATAVAANAAVAANTAKVTNAAHTGDVTGSGALTIDPTAISGKAASAGLSGTEEVLINEAGTLKKTTTQDIADLGGGGPVVLSSTSTGAQDDWAPGTLGARTVIKWAGTDKMILKGLAGASDAYDVKIINASATVPFVVMIEASTSTAANRFGAPILRPQHLIILPGEEVNLTYNGTSSRFVIGASQAFDFRARGEYYGTRVRGFASNEHSFGIEQISSGSVSSSSITGTTHYQSRAWFSGRTTAVLGTAANVTGRLNQLVPTSGFLYHCRFNFSQVFPGSVDAANPASANSAIAGLAVAAPGAATDVSAYASSILGWGRDPADAANLYAYINDSSGTPTKIDLGANFPTLTAAAVFDGFLFMPPGGASATLILMRGDDLTIAPSVEHVTTNLPNQGMLNLYQISNRAAAVEYFMRWDVTEYWRP